MNSDILNKICFTGILEDDAKGLAILDNECFSIPWSEQSFYNESKNNMAYYVIAKLDDKIIGYIGYWKVVDEGQITNVAVSNKFRRLGIAKKMLEIAIDNAIKDKLSNLSLEVRESNFAAIELYSQFGFKNVGMRKNYYHEPTENAVLMQLDL